MYALRLRGWGVAHSEDVIGGTGGWEWVAVCVGQHVEHDGERRHEHRRDVQRQRLGAPQQRQQHDHGEARVLWRALEQLHVEQREEHGGGEEDHDRIDGAPAAPLLVGVAAVLLHAHDGCVALKLRHVTPHCRPLVRERRPLPQRLERALCLVNGLVVQLGM